MNGIVVEAEHPVDFIGEFCVVDLPLRQAYEAPVNDTLESLMAVGKTSRKPS